MLDIKDFSKTYSGADYYSAYKINLHIDDGEVCGLVGSNGAGKSTIIKSVTGILPFEEGTVTVNGFDMKADPVKAKRTIGYVPDDHTVYDKLTGREYVNYIGSLYRVTKADKKAVIEGYAKLFNIEHALDNQIGSYSHGMKQKICIMGSIVHSPRLWILDEPMVGLDPQTMNELMMLIREYANQGNSVMFSSHNLDVVAKVCDKVAFIVKGKLVSLVDLRTVNPQTFNLDEYFMKLNVR